jgi:hypothetical protein
MNLTNFKKIFNETLNITLKKHLNLDTNLQIKNKKTILNKYDYRGIIFNIKSNRLLSHINVFINSDFYNAIEDFHFDEFIKDHSSKCKTYKTHHNNNPLYFPNPFYIDDFVEFYNVVFFIDFFINNLNNATDKIFDFKLDMNENIFLENQKFLKKAKGNTPFKHNLTLFEINSIFIINNKLDFANYYNSRNIDTNIFQLDFKKKKLDNVFLYDSKYILGIPENFKIYF